MGLTASNSGLFSIPGFIISPVGKGERRGKKRDVKQEKGNRKGMEGRKEEGIKKDRRQDKKEF